MNVSAEEHLTSGQLLKSITNLRRHYRKSIVGKERNFEKDYVIGKIIGEGAFSKVHECTCLLTGRKFAVKVIKVKNISEERSTFLGELAVSSSINHRNLCTLVDVYATESRIYAVHEMAECDLFDKFSEVNGFDENTTRNIVRQILKGVAYLHEAGYVHRDIKVENILYFGPNSEEKIKLGDFGFTKKLDELNEKYFKTKNNDFCGTAHYIPPEILKGEKYTYEADIWSLGILTYSLLCGYFPFDGENHDSLLQKITKSDARFHSKYWSHISADAKDFILCMLKKEPYRRWSAADLLRHSWMRQ